MKSIKAFYLETYKDRFFMDTPPFFEFFMWTEVFFQGPVMLWSIGALLKGEDVPDSIPHDSQSYPPTLVVSSIIFAENCTDSPKIPLVLLPFAVVIFITTGACMYEFASWDVPLKEKISLSTLYGPYLAICKKPADLQHRASLKLTSPLAAFMIGDMTRRLNAVINRAGSMAGSKKVQ